MDRQPTLLPYFENSLSEFPILNGARLVALSICKLTPITHPLCGNHVVIQRIVTAHACFHLISVLQVHADIVLLPVVTRLWCVDVTWVSLANEVEFLEWKLKEVRLILLSLARFSPISIRLIRVWCGSRLGISCFLAGDIRVFFLYTLNFKAFFAKNTIWHIFRFFVKWWTERIRWSCTSLTIFTSLFRVVILIWRVRICLDGLGLHSANLLAFDIWGDFFIFFLGP